ncbi:DUF3784 domain-containing protein [Clostridium oceanicum]|uniref:DUF3784 domain-containing protein n=1 Tax=Clostridium oceanicum TaxID=1543 RepID=A0ABN1JDZ1_9CLOT
MDVGIIILVAVTLLFVILGIVLKCGKGSFLIAGYNMASEEEKAKYDEKALCNFMGNLMLVISAIIIFMGICLVLELESLKPIATCLIPIVTIGAIIYTNTGNRFKK